MMKLFGLQIILVSIFSLVIGDFTKSHAAAAPKDLDICSFNIQFLGSFRLRNTDALAGIVSEADCDVVVVQELVAPPDLRVIPGSEYFGKDILPLYPSGEPHKASSASTEFFISMYEAGYDKFHLSEQDTGTGRDINHNGASTEWYVTFFKSSKVKKAPDLATGFISSKGKNLAGHGIYERVPYALGLRTLDDKYDFVLVSVHLRPGSGPFNRRRRKVELNGIRRWMERRMKRTSEQNYIILGDMNINKGKYLERTTPKGFVSLNYNNLPTNTNIHSDKPYDHVMIVPENNPEIPVEDNFMVYDLVKMAEKYWSFNIPYPGDPYNHLGFRQVFSDHQPIKFKIYPGKKDLD